MSVSCIVPNFNHGPFLAERLSSIAKQTSPPEELLILDDCSTDNSRDIITKFSKQSPIPTKLCFNEENSGSPFSQWARGVEMCSSKYVWIAESDDTAESNFLEILMHELKPNTLLAFSESIVIDSQGNRIGSMRDRAERYTPGRWGENFKMECSEALNRLFSRFNAIPNVSACLIQREALLSALRTKFSFRLCGDWFTYLQMLSSSNGEIAYVSSELNHYRSHSSNVRSEMCGSFEDLMERFEILRFLRVDCSVSAEALSPLESELLTNWALLPQASKGNYPLSKHRFLFEAAMSAKCYHSPSLLRMALRNLRQRIGWI